MDELIECIEFIESYKEGLIESFKESENILYSLIETLLKDYSDHINEEEISEINDIVEDLNPSDVNRLLEIAHNAKTRSESCKTPNKGKKLHMSQNKVSKEKTVKETRHIYPRGSGFQYLCNLAKEKSEKEKIDPERISMFKEIISEISTTSKIPMDLNARNIKKANLKKQIEILKSKLAKLEIKPKHTIRAVKRKAKEEISTTDDKL